MNAEFVLEVNSFRTLVKDFACLTVSGQIVPQNSPAVAEAISIVIHWVIGSWQGGNSKIVFRISKVIRIK